jgi:cell division septum initiation protein DivIVA
VARQQILCAQRGTPDEANDDSDNDDGQEKSVTAPGNATDAAREQARDVAQNTMERASTVGDHARDAAGDVTSTAAEQARQVRDTAVEQATNVMAQARDQLNEHGNAQVHQLGSTLRQLANEFERMAGHGESGSMATSAVSEASRRAHQLADMTEGHELRDVIDQLRGVARRRPGSFLVGALALGVVSGRLARGAKSAGSEGSQITQQTAQWSSPAAFESPDTQIVLPDAANESRVSAGSEAVR